MKKLCKIIFVFFIITTIYLQFFNTYADGIWDTAKDFLDIGSGELSHINDDEVKDAILGLADFLWGIGLIVILITTVILGIKYMTVPPNEKSRVKQATTPYIIGVVIIFGALTIWRLVINVLEGSLGIGG